MNVRPFKVRKLGFVLIALALCAPLCVAQQITVAAAADLQFAMQDIVDRYQRQTSQTVRMIYGSSGNLFEQIQNGAPFDIFFSANLDYPKKLQAAELAEPGSYYEYARGKIALWVPNKSKVNLSSGIAVLADPAVNKIAIANPQHAPYGRAAVAAMQQEKIYEKVKDKLVLGENISQAASFVVSGAADVGILALSLAMSPELKSKGRYVEVPSEKYPPVVQACVILSSSKNKAASQQFLAFVKTPAMRTVLSTYGFDVQDGRTP